MLKCRLILSFILLIFTLSGKELKANTISHFSDIQKLIQQEDYVGAQKILDEQIAHYQKQNPDSLLELIQPMAQIFLRLGTENQAQTKVEHLIQTIHLISKNSRTHIQAYMLLAEFYNNIAKEKLAYQTYQKSFQLAEKFHPNDQNFKGKIHHNLSTTAYRMGDLKLADEHRYLAEKHIHQADQPDFETLYNIYNGKGRSFYFAYQLDSAEYYFSKALDFLQQSNRDDLGKKYGSAVIYNNLSGIYSQQGQTTKAMQAMRKVIDHLDEYIRLHPTSNKKIEAVEFRLEATDNLAGLYKSIGDYHKALQLLLYAYDRKKKDLPNGSSAIYKSELLLGQIYYALKDYPRAKTFLNAGLEKIPKDDVYSSFWEADAYYSMALVQDACKNITEAKKFYTKADEVYQIALQGQSDQIYLEFLNNKALFLAENNELNDAVKTAQKVMEYTSDSDGENTLQSVLNFTNLSKIYFLGGDDQQAKLYSQKAISTAQNIIHQSAKNILDSARIEIHLPQALLLQARSSYRNLDHKNIDSLDAWIQQLLQMEKVFYRKQQLLSYEKDQGFVRNDQHELNGFVSHLLHQKYILNGDQKVLNDIIQLHENGVYQTIRSHINRQDFVKFHNIPDSVQSKEKFLKNQLSQSLQTDSTNKNQLQDFFEAEKKWSAFQDFLKKKYPKYYAAKFQSSEKWDIQQLLKNLPDDVAVVRYLFIEKELFAYVIQNESQHWLSLKMDQLDENIRTLSNFQNDEKKVLNAAHQLYLDLWAPIEKHLKHSRVIIIPESILYHLSFDMLSSQAIQTYQQLKQHALVHRYAFSYHFSLLALQDAKSKKAKQNGFIAFTPAFTDQEKLSYRKNKDTSSHNWDEEYMSLLPLPFSVTLAKKAEKQFGGVSYTGSKSTVGAFEKESAQHSIIHIGTHAMANDDYPEYSKIIFAKDPAQPDAEHIVYLYDLYQYDLTSDIAVLTACESGKPGLSPGEGMISMSHAFMYAGSESILTGLWKIDEQSTTRIIEIFYEKIDQGLPKDIALQEAKITYLNEAVGRTIQPMYWAGLVIMGDISPIDVGSDSNWFWYVVAGIVGIVLLYRVVRRLRKI